MAPDQQGEAGCSEAEESSSAYVLGSNLYARADGTLAYFFTPEYLRALFGACGLRCEYLYTDSRLQVNRATRQRMYRRWLQAKFVAAPNPLTPID